MNKKSNILILLGSMFLLAALLLTGYNRWTDNQAKDLAEIAVNEVKKEVDQPEQAKAQQDCTGEIPIPAYCLNPEMEMPVYVLDGQEYIGVISIPELELELPLLSEWSYPNLRVSPCRYEGSAYLGNMIVAAHNYLSHFGRLDKLTTGSLVLFTDMDGNEFRYQVSEMEIRNPTDISGLSAGEWDLTLFTCTVAGNTRLVVRCTAI